MMFNMYLDAKINNNELLKKLANSGKLIAYADDLFIIADNKVETE